jgi:hypothetical protein
MVTNVVQKFKKIEKENNLFEAEVLNEKIWERVRFRVFRKIKSEVYDKQAHNRVRKGIYENIRKVGLFVRNIFAHNPLLCRSRDHVIFGHSRRKKEKDEWVDIYTDPLLAGCKMDSVHIENPHLLHHKRPAKTKNIKYLDLVKFSSSMLRKMGLIGVSLNRHDEATLCEIDSTVNKYYEKNIDIKGLLRKRVRVLKSLTWGYRKLLSLIKPSVAIVVVSYAKKAFIDACHAEKIPVVELQHGVINNNHISYSYPNDVSVKCFPDYLLTWGRYWHRNVSFPIPSSRVMPVGYPYLEQKAEEYEDVESKKKVLFLSQGTIGDELSSLALNMSRESSDYEIVYKLHPGEYASWGEKYTGLVNEDVTIVGEEGPSLYRLFAESTAQVGVSSTALYEGLQFDLETFIYECPEAAPLDDLVTRGIAATVSSAEELMAAVGQQADVALESEQYFRPDAAKRMCRRLEQLDHLLYPNAVSVVILRVKSL